MKLNNKIIYLILAIMIISFFIGMFVSMMKEKSENQIGSEKNVINIALEDGVEDECTEEWIEYNKELQAAFEQANSNIDESDTHFIIRNENGYVYVYYLDENKKEYLYKTTEISVDYLSEEDILDLEHGIEVIGNEELNKVLENFE